MTATPDHARAEVDRLEALAIHWDREAEDAARELVELESSRGAEVLDAGVDAAERARELSGSIAALREHVETSRAAAAAASVQLDGARLAVHAADAAVLREQAAEKQAEADRHQATTEKLVAKLAEHEGTGTSTPEVRWLPMQTLTYPATGETFDEEASTISKRLAREAATLRGRAVELEAKAEGREVHVPTSIIDGAPDYAALESLDA